jgi:hypothetical protein
VDTAVSLAGFIIHRTWSMPCSEALTVSAANTCPSRLSSAEVWPFVLAQATSTPAQKRPANALMYFATRDAPATGMREARTTPPPSE